MGDAPTPSTATSTAAAAGKPPRESRFEVAGWRFTARHGDAMDSQARAALARDELAPLSTRVPLPEMVFAQNVLTVAHPSQRVRLRFEVAPALKLWARAHAGDHWDHTNFDFTYCTNYHGSVERYVDEDDSNGDEVQAVPTPERMPLEQLLQHVEILYYDRVILFEDDVRDLGEIYLEVKIRVMNFGFLVLCRYYCRVDGKSVRLMDTRYYQEFGEDFIWRDHEAREASVGELHKILHAGSHGGHRLAPSDYSADAIYTALQPSTTTTEKIFLSR